MEEEEAEISPVELKDSKDGAIDIVLTVAKKISQLLEGDIDSLKLPKIITKLLKTLKAIVGLLKLEDAKDKSNAEGEKDRLEQLLQLLYAINNVLLGANNNNNQPALSQPRPSRARPSFVLAHPGLRPSGGVCVKNMKSIRVRNRAIKIKKLLPQARNINVKKNGVVVRKLVVRRKTCFPGRRARTY